MLGKSLSWKDIKWHCIISIVITILLTLSFFGAGENTMISSDLEKINIDFKPTYIIGEPFQSVKLAAHSWENHPYFAWPQDFRSSNENKETLRGYNLELGSNIPLREKIQLSVNFNRQSDRSYEDFIFVFHRDSKPPNEFLNKKCYEVLCVYGK